MLAKGQSSDIMLNKQDSQRQTHSKFEWWECKMLQLLRRGTWHVRAKCHRYLPFDLAITLLGFFRRNAGNETKRHMYQAVHFGTVWNSKKLERTQKPVNIDLVGLVILCLPKGVLYSCKRKCRTFLYSTQTSKLPHALSVLIIVSWHSWAKRNI